VQAFRPVTEKHPQSEEAPLAWYQLGSSLYNSKSWAEAATAFEKASSFPKSEVAAESLFWAGQSRAKAGELAVSRPHYERFLSLIGAPGASAKYKDAMAWAPLARLGLGRSLLESDSARSEALLRQALISTSAKLPASASAEAQWRLAQALQAQIRWKEASVQALKVATIHADSEWASDASWLAAEAAEKGGEAQTATTLYRAIAAQNPPGPHARQAQERLKALGN
jgi:TolA-binding protein